MEYTELDVWKESRKLVIQVYELVESFPKEEVFGLSSQIRRSCISVPSNIAEGCGRRTSTDTIRFLYMARGSLYELETQLYLASDLKLIDEVNLKITLDQIILCKRLLSGFINYHASKK